MLPRSFPTRRGIDAFGRLIPARAVGGDLFDVVEWENRLFLLVGDVSGKGVAAALFMAVTKALFRASVDGDARPGSVLARMNRELARDNERSMFVTAYLACLDLTTLTLVFANAGHNPPLRVRSGAVTALADAHGMALGIFGDYVYPEASTTLEPGDALFLFTDGIVEAQDSAGAQFSDARLAAELVRLEGASALGIVDGVLAAVRAFVGRTPQFDDITALALRIESDQE
jgi:sigma-B regulation protein RsbU (phosphoserine phosphatase)